MRQGFALRGLSSLLIDVLGDAAAGVSLDLLHHFHLLTVLTKQGGRRMAASVPLTCFFSPAAFAAGRIQ